MAARLALKRPPRTSPGPLLKQLHWLPIRQRIKFKHCCLAHKALYGASPSYLAEKFKVYCPNRQFRSEGKGLLVVPRFRKIRTGGKTIAYLALKYWNTLPEDLRKCPSLFRFRKLLKTELFRG